VIRKPVTRGSEGGRWKSAHKGNSLAAYPTPCTVLRGLGAGNRAWLPDLEECGKALGKKCLTGLLEMWEQTFA